MKKLRMEKRLQTMNISERYIKVYKFAKEFLKILVEEQPKLNKSILDMHLHDKSKFENLNDANKVLIGTLCNRNMMASVIGFTVKEKRLRKILFNYDPYKILNNYSDLELLSVFKKNFEIKNIKSKRNLWRKFSEGIISGSKFMSTFKNKNEFDKFVKTFSFNKYTKASLPVLLGNEIDGFGFALACDFLKELGYRDYPKPDVHLIKIFSELGLCKSSKPYEIYKSIIEMAEYVNEDAYIVDKTFWLISSGNFYLVELSNKKILKIGRNRDKFIKEARKKLKLV